MDQQLLLRLHISQNRRNVLRIDARIVGAHDNDSQRCRNQVQCGSDKRLIRFEVNACGSQKNTVENAEQNRHPEYGKNLKGRGRCFGEQIHGQSTAQAAHNHDAFQTQVNDAGMLREAAAQCCQRENSRKNDCVLY